MSVDIEIASAATPELVESLNHLLPQLSTSASPLSSSDVQSLVDASAVTLFVARSEEHIVGSLTLVIFPIPTGLRAWIEDVVVDEPARGRGVASALVDHAVREARRAGASTVDLTSRPSREVANRLYRALGFSPRETNVYRLMLGG